MLCTVSADEENVLQRAVAKENEPLTQTLVSSTFTFVPTLTELLKPELRWLRNFIMCRGSQIHTESRNMPSGGATPTLTISVHSCFFFLFPSKWGYSFAPLMSAAALALDEPRALWTLPFGRRRKKSKLLSLLDCLIRLLAPWMSRREAFLSNVQRVLQSQGGY